VGEALMATYKPRPSDVSWIKALVSSLAIGGVWGYKDQPIMFKKIGEKAMALVAAPFGDARMDEEIARNKAVMAEAGITLVDQRNKQ
jgi:hypothetical protein